MTSLGFFLVVVGVLLALTRGPFLLAPERTKALYLQIFEAATRMRFLGLFIASGGAWAAVVGTSDAGSVAHFVYYLGIFMLFLAASIIALPVPMGTMARNVWNRFNASTLRLMGALAVVFGILIAFYGASL